MSGEIDPALHADIFPGNVNDYRVLIIGVGATGSWLTLFLLKSGFRGEHITCIDADHVEMRNLGNQFHDVESARTGRPKVEALADNVERFSGERPAFEKRFVAPGEDLNYDIVVFALDKNDERRKIFEQSIRDRPYPQVLIDIRLGDGFAHAYQVNPSDDAEVERYLGAMLPSNRFPPEADVCNRPIPMVLVPVFGALLGAAEIVSWMREKTGAAREGIDVQVYNVFGRLFPLGMHVELKG